MTAKELFSKTLPEHAILADPADLAHYGHDWSKDFAAKASLILLPENTEQIQEIVRIANREHLALVPSGGRTGLSGGATATNSEIVVSLERMQKILAVNPIDRTLSCQAGVTTQRVQEEARKHKLYFGIDFSSKGTSQIGGNLSTNAGGIRVIKYGNFRESVLGLKVVTGAGQLLNLDQALFKNQTGYDLKQLFIGAEGTLGIVTEVTLKLTSEPGERVRMLCALDNAEGILEFFTLLRNQFSQLSAFEFFSRDALELVIKHRQIKNPFNQFYSHYLLIEIEQGNANLRAQIEQLLFSLIEKEKISDALVAQSLKHGQELMAIRESIPEILSTYYSPHKNDISVPIPKVTEFVTKLQSLVSKNYQGIAVVVFGHIGDGNLHLNILKPENQEQQAFLDFCKQADRAVFELVQSFGGSISAEHGVGLLKKNFLSYSRSKEEIELMKQIKLVFDPKGVLNPGKIFDLG